MTGMQRALVARMFLMTFLMGALLGAAVATAFVLPQLAACR